MNVVTEITELRATLDSTRASGATVGLVPTMGFLHQGHLSLMTRSVADNDLTLTTIFVNPLQFGEGEDLAAYPRDLERDTELCAGEGVDIVFAPTVDEMYPEPIATTVTVGEVAAPMEGAARPGHFAGVATVVAKLFNIAGTCRAYFGEKDWQQLAVIRRMAADLSFPVEVVGCPIVREADGLACSSRNIYLEPDEREAAAVLSRALRAGVESVDAGERDPDAVRAVVAELIGAEPLVAEPDYIEVVDAHTLARQPTLAGEIRLLVAARVGRARLIDNMGAVAS